MADPEVPASGVSAYGDFVDDELQAQEARKSSIEQRGAGVVTTSGVLVTLLLALAGLATEASKTVILPHAARWWLVAALIAFIVATLLALLTNIPLHYEAVTAAAIKGRLDETPIKSVPEAQLDIALTRAKALADAKCKNGVKAWFLFAAITCEAIAVGLLGVAVHRHIAVSGRSARVGRLKASASGFA